MIFDTHLHLIDRSHLSYPWLSGLPALDRDWGYDDYAAVARRVGITKVLHMEVDVAEADIDRETAWIAELMEQPNSLIVGAISSARPESDCFEPWLERADRRIIRGVRRVLHVMTDEVSQNARFRLNIRKLGDAGFPFDICMLQRQLPLALELADACPDTIFVLDHCGVPTIKDDQIDDWSIQIARLAERPNVNVKLSGITSYGPSDWTLLTLQPYLDRLLETFGPKRIVWGSDSPVCTLQSSLDQWLATTHALLSCVSPEERVNILFSNAHRIWKIPE
jgi:predicted TIM-barrel fold metal-dependent hydrolase